MPCSVWLASTGSDVTVPVVRSMTDIVSPEVVGHDHPARVEERHAFGVHVRRVRVRDDRSAGHAHVDLQDLLVGPHRDVDELSRGVVRIEGHLEGLAVAQVDHAQQLAPGGRGGVDVVDQQVRREHARHDEALAVGRRREARDVPVRRAPGHALAGWELDGRAVGSRQRARGRVHREGLHDAVVGGHVDGARRHEDGRGVERLGVVEAHRAGDRRAAAADLRRIDDAHRVIVGAVVDGHDQAGLREGGHEGGEPALQVVLVEDPVAAGWRDAVTVGQDHGAGVGGVDPGVLCRLAGGRRRAALALHGSREATVPGLARCRVGD